jgi:hypothetical protein
VKEGNRENDRKIKGTKKLKEGLKRKRGKTESVKFSSKEISFSRMSNSVTPLQAPATVHASIPMSL